MTSHKTENVILPVLSQHMYVAQPKASTAGSFLMMAFFFAILITPRASVTVTQMGRPSGIAATASDTPNAIEWNRGVKWKSCGKRTNIRISIVADLIDLRKGKKR